MSTKKRLWQAWAKIVGPRLPVSSVRFGNAELRMLPHGQHPPKASPVHPQPEDNVPFFVTTAASTDITSDWWLVIHDIESDDPDEALRIAQLREVPLALAALCAGSHEQPYRVDLQGVESGPESYSYSIVQSMVMFEKTELPLADIGRALDDRLPKIRLHHSLNSASLAFSRGIELSDMPNGSATAASSILAFYQVLEACSHVVPWEPPSDYDAQKASIITKLATSLASRKNPHHKANSIEAAASALGRLDAKYMTLRIENAAAVLGLSDEWKKSAKNLSKFRNTKLGHGGGTLPDESLHGWHHGEARPDSAYALASTMLARAIDYTK